MTATELISAIDALGGSLTIQGDRIECELTPEAKELLLPELKANRDGVYAALVERDRETRAMVEVETACRCDKWPFAHIHNPEDRAKARRAWNRDSSG